MHTPLYTEKDYEAIVKQQHKRWLLLTLPCLLLLAVLLIALLSRILWLASTVTILIGVLLIAGNDLLIKPLHCYGLHLDHSLHGRTSFSVRIRTARAAPMSAFSTSTLRRSSRPSSPAPSCTSPITTCLLPILSSFDPLEAEAVSATILLVLNKIFKT